MKSEKGGLKRKIGLLFVSLVIAIAVALLIMKFVFPEIDTDLAFEKNYQLSQEKDENFDANYKKVYDFFATVYVSEESEEYRITNNNLSLKNQLDVFNNWLSQDLVNIQNQKGLKDDYKLLNKKIQQVQDSREVLTKYFSQQIIPYIDDANRVMASCDAYFETLTKKTIPFLNEYASLNSVLADICFKYGNITLSNTSMKIQIRQVLASWSVKLGEKILAESNENVAKVQKLQTDSLLSITKYVCETYEFENKFELENDFARACEVADVNTYLSVVYSTNESAYLESLTAEQKTKAENFKTHVLGMFLV